MQWKRWEFLKQRSKRRSFLVLLLYRFLLLPILNLDFYLGR